MNTTLRQLEKYLEKVDRQREEIQKRIIGLSQFIEALLICFYSHSERKLGPHLLVEGKVGKGKTAVLETFSRTISDATFSRIQFSPDLKPLDLVRIVEQHEDRTFSFHPGPLFVNLVLADEINRAHEKTRSTLLEAMGEKQVSIGRDTYHLEEPFFVMATENPVDVEGTFMLGAAQLDRFMMKIYTEPLSMEEELLIAKTHHEQDIDIKAVISKTEVLEIQKFIRDKIIIDEETSKTIIQIVRALRPEGGIVIPDDFYLLPEGERGFLFLERGAKTRAFLQGRNYVNFDDISALVFPVLNHRIGFQYAPSDLGKMLKAKEIISAALEKVIKNGARGLKTI